ncbi:MAG: FHA domain-containing protein [Gammaproteobacteria bacterium]|nr:FHA domain-containing protein [Gammaproteobacteria bacterium]
MAALIVEELNRIGHVVNRYKVDHFPASIGRGYGNDIILDDQYISPVHVTITQSEDDVIVLNDSSLNGIECEGNTTVGSGVELISGQEFVLGHTRLRFYSPDHKIPETRSTKHSEGLAKKFVQPGMLTLILLIFFVMLFSNVMLSATQELTFKKGLTEFLSPVMFVVVWAAVWAFAGRLIRHQPQFLTHIVVITLFLILSNISDWLAGVSDFNLIPKVAIDIFEMGIVGLMFVWLINNHLRYSTSLLKFTRMLGASAFAVCIVGLYYLNILAVNDRNLFEPLYSTTIRAPYAKIRDDSSIEKYLEDTKVIFDISLDKEK